MGQHNVRLFLSLLESKPSVLEGYIDKGWIGESLFEIRLSTSSLIMSSHSDKIHTLFYISTVIPNC